MLYYHHNTSTPQILEGIDKIQLKLNENLSPVKRFKLNKYGNELNIIKKNSSAEFRSGAYYLNIHGEFIDHSDTLYVTITKALLVCIQEGVFSLGGDNDNIPLIEYNLYFIRKNIELFIDTTISEIEFCFDFMPNSIIIKGPFIICQKMTGINIQYINYKKLSIKERLKTRKLLKYKYTFYSLDDNGGLRHSTIAIYNRNLKLHDKKTEYKSILIDANIYSQRIEFRLTNKAYRKLLSIENMKGDYKTVVEWFSPTLVNRFYTFFYGLVDIIDDGQHPIFQSIYKEVLALAENNKPFNTRVSKKSSNLTRIKSTPRGNLGNRFKKNKHPNDIKKALKEEIERQENTEKHFGPAPAR
ncbi:hypothetical protein FACS189483_09740 [Spirochaetia bacterium]|nr:hypothetical protein FACS189483_09740 [Spirochaetia bacterium]